MAIDDNRIDLMLAAALRGDPAVWPAVAGEQAVIDRIAYHGIAGLLNEQASKLGDWPATVRDFLRRQAIALAMWELRHKAVLGDVFAAFASAKVTALLLKGTALAYDLYPVPATRARGDTDVAVSPNDLGTARRVLERLGFSRQSLDAGIADDLALQEVWSLDCGDGTIHHIDLHWQLLNAPALRGVLAFGQCAANPQALPRLHPDAQAMALPLNLLHTCVHRAMHLTSPYFVGGVVHYGGDRLIWAKDIALLAGALSEEMWRVFTTTALDQGIAAVCHDGLDLARRTFGSAIPDHVMASLASARGERPSTYLLRSGQAGRAWADLRAIGGWRRRIAYLAARGVPSAEFMRGKYPEMDDRPLIMLHARRMIDLVRPRVHQSGRG